MKNLHKIIGLLGIVLLPHFTKAQQMMVKKFILPDGKEILPDKLDSVKKAWNGERILFQHNDEDDKNQVMRLVRMTPEMARMLAEQDLKRQRAILEMTGKPAPEFSFSDLKGKKWTLSKLRGKVVVLNFWFTSCPPCIQEMPKLNELVDHYKHKDVFFLALTFNDRLKAGAFLSTHKFAYTVLPGSGDADKAYQITSWPASFVIGRDGHIKTVLGSEEDIAASLSKQIERELRSQ
ncbi:peroxiredoxin [Mucilaginibacter rubeus]|uniref:TlpA family protein disulfide reductase n=1 Tax=Mucilaginibacter rubeus TaxID=2027860 RepID=UPI00339B93FA